MSARAGGSNDTSEPSALFDRLASWVELLRKRDDLSWPQPLRTQPQEHVFERYPSDARDFAARCGQLSFSYRSKSATNDGSTAAGFLYLDLTGAQEPAYMVLPGGAIVDEETMFIVDCDGEGTGQAAWYVLPEDGARDEPRIVWSVESTIAFPSLTDYVTAGARKGFSCAGRAWQDPSTPPSLAAISMPRDTPVPELRAALVRRGARPEVADDLIEWLGADVALLLPIGA